MHALPAVTYELHSPLITVLSHVVSSHIPQATVMQSLAHPVDPLHDAETRGSAQR
jgi:hypothetical protein